MAPTQHFTQSLVTNLATGIEGANLWSRPLSLSRVHRTLHVGGSWSAVQLVELDLVPGLDRVRANQLDLCVPSFPQRRGQLPPMDNSQRKGELAEPHQGWIRDKV